jgi:hypothetical protein
MIPKKRDVMLEIDQKSISLSQRTPPRCFRIELP